jgi:hypothetical protein
MVRRKGAAVSLIDVKTVLGLPLRFVATHWFFGVIIAVLSVNLVTEGPEDIDASLILLAAMNTLVYPYARFLYSWVAKVLLGDRKMVFHGRWILLRFVYVFAVAVMLWSLSVLLAPIGMLVRYTTKGNSPS